MNAAASRATDVAQSPASRVSSFQRMLDLEKMHKMERLQNAHLSYFPLQHTHIQSPSQLPPRFPLSSHHSYYHPTPPHPHQAPPPRASMSDTIYRRSTAPSLSITVPNIELDVSEAMAIPTQQQLPQHHQQQSALTDAKPALKTLQFGVTAKPRPSEAGRVSASQIDLLNPYKQVKFASPATGRADTGCQKAEDEDGDVKDDESCLSEKSSICVSPSWEGYGFGRKSQKKLEAMEKEKEKKQRAKEEKEREKEREKAAAREQAKEKEKEKEKAKGKAQRKGAKLSKLPPNQLRPEPSRTTSAPFLQGIASPPDTSNSDQAARRRSEHRSTPFLPLRNVPTAAEAAAAVAAAYEKRAQVAAVVAPKREFIGGLKLEQERFEEAMRRRDSSPAPHAAPMSHPPPRSDLRLRTQKSRSMAPGSELAVLAAATDGDALTNPDQSRGHTPGPPSSSKTTWFARHWRSQSMTNEALERTEPLPTSGPNLKALGGAVKMFHERERNRERPPSAYKASPTSQTFVDEHTPAERGRPNDRQPGATGRADSPRLRGPSQSSTKSSERSASRTRSRRPSFTLPGATLRAFRARSKSHSRPATSTSTSTSSSSHDARPSTHEAHAPFQFGLPADRTSTSSSHSRHSSCMSSEQGPAHGAGNGGGESHLASQVCGGGRVSMGSSIGSPHAITSSTPTSPFYRPPSAIYSFATAALAPLTQPEGPLQEKLQQQQRQRQSSLPAGLGRARRSHETPHSLVLEEMTPPPPIHPDSLTSDSSSSSMHEDYGSFASPATTPDTVRSPFPKDSTLSFATAVEVLESRQATASPKSARHAKHHDTTGTHRHFPDASWPLSEPMAPSQPPLDQQPTDVSLDWLTAVGGELENREFPFSPPPSAKSAAAAADQLDRKFTLAREPTLMDLVRAEEQCWGSCDEVLSPPKLDPVIPQRNPSLSKSFSDPDLSDQATDASRPQRRIPLVAKVDRKPRMHMPESDDSSSADVHATAGKPNGSHQDMIPPAPNRPSSWGRPTSASSGKEPERKSWDADRAAPALANGQQQQQQPQQPPPQQPTRTRQSVLSSAEYLREARKTVTLAVTDKTSGAAKSFVSGSGAARTSAPPSARGVPIVPVRVPGPAVTPFAKVFVQCCACSQYHDMPARVYECMTNPDSVVEDKKRGVSGQITTMVKCPWCQHNMTTHCCAGYAAVVYLKERLH